jgi:hypothetical protein
MKRRTTEAAIDLRGENISHLLLYENLNIDGLIFEQIMVVVGYKSILDISQTLKC